MPIIGSSLPPFRLYGLSGCPHCAQAEQFLTANNIPFLTIFGDDDPIVYSGIAAVTGKPEAQYPVLCCTFNKEIVTGFQKDKYERLANAFNVLFSTTVPDGASSPEQPVSEAQAAPAADSTGAN